MVRVPLDREGLEIRADRQRSAGYRPHLVDLPAGKQLQQLETAPAGRNRPMSVMMRPTVPAGAVNGRLHSSSSRGLPSRVVCCIIRWTFRAQATRSIAPPMPPRLGALVVRRLPVREGAVLCDLIRAEDRAVQVPAADEREGVGARKEFHGVPGPNPGIMMVAPSRIDATASAIDRY